MLGNCRSVVVITIVVDLNYSGVTEVDAAGMARIGHERTAPGLNAGTAQRLASLDRMPDGGPIVTGEETTAAQPDEKRAQRVPSCRFQQREGTACGNTNVPPQRVTRARI